jgi:hypothetical protein
MALCKIGGTHLYIPLLFSPSGVPVNTLLHPMTLSAHYRTGLTLLDKIFKELSSPLNPALWIVIPIILLSSAAIIVGYILPMIRRLPLKPLRKVTPVLFIKRGQQTVKRFTLKKVPCLIGRDPSNEIYLNDPQIDRQHAKILELSTGYGLVDLGSKQGTLLNGKPAPTQPVLLRSGDEVQVGGVLLVFGV